MPFEWIKHKLREEINITNYFFTIIQDLFSPEARFKSLVCFIDHRLTPHCNVLEVVFVMGMP